MYAARGGRLRRPTMRLFYVFLAGEWVGVVDAVLYAGAIRQATNLYGPRCTVREVL